jgi:putative endonuclease
MHYVYILLLSSKKRYIGQTEDLKQRIKKHNEGGVISTSNYRPIKLVWYCAFSDKETAIKFEKYLKNASGRAFFNKHLN